MQLQLVLLKTFCGGIINSRPLSGGHHGGSKHEDLATSRIFLLKYPKRTDHPNGQKRIIRHVQIEDGSIHDIFQKETQTGFLTEV